MMINFTTTPKNEDDELPPCPFCGSTDLDGPTLIEYVGDYYDPHWYIECNQCPCMMELYTKNKADIITAWSKRET